MTKQLQRFVENQFVSERQLADLLQIPMATLRFWRWAGRGPRFRRLGRSVRYRAEDLEAWIATRPEGGEAQEAAKGEAEAGGFVSGEPSREALEVISTREA